MNGSRVQTVRAAALTEDDVRAGGGGWNDRSPLVPAAGDLTAVRAIYRCSRCGKPVGRTVEYVAQSTGEMVVLFAGIDGAGRTTHAFLQPNLGAEPAAACTTHGALAVTRPDLEATVLRSRGLQYGAGRKTDAERTTCTVHLRPVSDTPEMTVNQRPGATARDRLVP